MYINQIPSTEYQRKLDLHAGKLIGHSIIATLIISGSFTLCIVGPIYAFVVHGDYVTPTGVILPFIDFNTGRGFAINILVQMSVTLVSLLGMITIEIGSCSAMAGMMCFNVRKFSDIKWNFGTYLCSSRIWKHIWMNWTTFSTGSSFCNQFWRLDVLHSEYFRNWFWVHKN